MNETPLQNANINKLLDYHLPIISIVICAILTVSALFSLGGWVYGVDDYHIPLLILGMSVITLGVVFNRGAIVVTLTILIVGVLIAPSNYLLRIAHMVAGSDAPFEQYARKYPGEDVGSTAPSTDDVVQRVIATLEEKGISVEESIQKELGRVVSAGTLRLIAARVNDADARFPLMEVNAGNIKEIFNEHGTEDYFREDMNFLRSENLVDFPESRIEDAEITELGQQVAAFLEDLDPFRFPGSPGQSTRFELDRPSPDQMKLLTLPSEPIPGTFQSGGVVDWYRFSIPSEDTYRISVMSDRGDPLIRLYGPDDFVNYLEDDDSGGGKRGLDAKIQKNLTPGDYYIGVTNLDDATDRYSIGVSEE